ncbi:helix-turn-helix domain-containing protein [Alicyclobacillus curvatus]|nr:helix-turn-helix domain-containing protein [Alicyclobacillus curvatus]
MTQLYTPLEVAEILKVHRMTVYQMVREKQLSCVRIGSAIRIPQSAIDEFIEASLVAQR